MTVEASLIVPMAVGIIVVLIYTAFYLFGMCLLVQDMYILGLRGSRPDTGSPYDSAAQYVVDYAPERIANRYFGNTPPEITAQDESGTVRITGETETRHGVMGGYFILPGEGQADIWAQRYTVELLIQRQTDHIRQVKRARDLLVGRNPAAGDADAGGGEGTE
ncbi:MAG: hypothetical protein IJT34_06520 [Butyrivibrio sp.]|nr:hypothetical protein [Butyrivibrio sp.]